MGSEASCRAEVRGGGASSSGNGKALLETNDLSFRGAFRLRIALKDVTQAAAENGVLVVETKDGTVARFEIGKAAARWAEKIRSPPSRLDKLGVTPTTDVAVIGAFDADFVTELEARARSVGGRAGTIFFAASVAKDLARVATLRKKLPDDGALWIVYPKGKREIREADVLAAGRAVGLKDVKVARFSETHTALRFVVPLALRAHKA